VGRGARIEKGLYRGERVGSGKKVEEEYCEKEREWKMVYIEGNGWAVVKIKLKWNGVRRSENLKGSI
jgi:hypothetical protein